MNETKTVTLLCLLTCLAGCDGGGRFEGELPGDCNDLADNDRDGRFDCADEGCASAPHCAPDGGPEILLMGDGGAPPPTTDAGPGGSPCVEVGGFYRGLPRGTDCSTALSGVDVAVSNQTGCAMSFDLTFDYADGTSDTELDLPGTLEPLGADRAQYFELIGDSGSLRMLFERDSSTDRVDLDVTIDTGSQVCEYTTRFGP